MKAHWKRIIPSQLKALKRHLESQFAKLEIAAADDELTAHIGVVRVVTLAVAHVIGIDGNVVFNIFIAHNFHGVRIDVSITLVGDSLGRVTVEVGDVRCFGIHQTALVPVACSGKAQVLILQVGVETHHEVGLRGA